MKVFDTYCIPCIPGTILDTGDKGVDEQNLTKPMPCQERRRKCNRYKKLRMHQKVVRALGRNKRGQEPRRGLGLL